MRKTREIVITVHKVSYAIGCWWRPRKDPFNQWECWFLSKKRPRYLSMGISLWRFALEFSAIERRAV